MRYLHLLATGACFALAASAQAQVNKEVQITKIEPVMENSPEYSISIGPQRRADSQKWLIVEVEFEYQPSNRKAPPFLDELTFNYYVLLKNGQGREIPPTLLVGSITHVAIPQGKGLRSAAFVSPRTLQRFFGGKAPANANAAVEAVGVTITLQGQVVAELSTGPAKGKQAWWTQLQQTPGLVLNKNETPFAPLFWDYYEALKSKPAGL